MAAKSGSSGGGENHAASKRRNRSISGEISAKALMAMTHQWLAAASEWRRKARS